MHPIMIEKLIATYQDDLARANRYPRPERGSRRSHHLLRRHRQAGDGSAVS